MIPFSVLDLSPITQGSDAAHSFRNTLDLARHAERWGYRRFWLAEHHGMPGIASAATAVLIGHVAGGTSTIRVGAGGIMLPNHSPLVIAEQFGTLESLYPGRIDLGLGRAPGSDQRTAQALRRNFASSPDEFPRDVQELADYFSDSPRQTVRAVPGTGLKVPLWILGSSLFWRAGCRSVWPTVCVCIAFCARADDGRDRVVPERVSALADARQALCHARLQCVRRRFSGGGEIPGNLDAAGIREFAQRPSFAAARLPLKGTLSASDRRSGRSWIRYCRAPRSAPPRWYARICTISSSKPARTS